MLQPPLSFFPTPVNEPLFTGLWIRWRALTLAERFVCANLALFPCWWLAGLLYYMPLLLLVGVLVYQCQQQGKLPLRFPSAPVLLLFAFGAYQLLRLFFARSLTSQLLMEVVILSLCPACWLWYVQSYRIRVRLQVVAWAASVCVVQMLLLWLGIEAGILSQLFYPPRLRTLFAILARRGTDGYSNLNSSFYLAPYEPYGNIVGRSRYNFFFVQPEFFALVTAFWGLLALELRRRFWSIGLLAASILLLLLSGTRAVWLAFPLLLTLRYLLLHLRKPWGLPLFLAGVAGASFMVLSLPPVTEWVSHTLTHSSQSIDQLRADSSEIRYAIYQQTWEGFKASPIWGHLSKGEAVNPYLPFARIGTHSFILGNLLYRNGLVGTAIFVTFWVSLLHWFYKTRLGRPFVCLGMLLLYMLVSPTMELVYEMSISSFLLLICVTLRSPQKRPCYL